MTLSRLSGSEAATVSTAVVFSTTLAVAALVNAGGPLGACEVVPAPAGDQALSPSALRALTCTS